MIEMMMEAAQELMGSKDLAHIIKGKRTKRPRPLSPLTLMLTTNSSSSSHGESEGERERIISVNNMTSPSTSVELTENSIGEEEDMANCLILLAQGHQNYKLPKSATTTTTTVSSKAEASATATATAGGLYVHQCKTCNRCFPSFQALGGHRASHKKPKTNNINEERRAFSIMEEEDVDHEVNKMSTTLSLQISNKALLSINNNFMKSSKVHECSICGAEFSSGQALGGHMRRHRTFLSTSAATTTTTTMSLGASSAESQESKKPRINNLELDLNLPAPEDIDARESKFHFASKEQVLVFSASPLVDCPY